MTAPREETRELILGFARQSAFPIRHIWHPDDGYRRSIILNAAILASKGDYLVFSDGDCIPRRDFVRTHIELAEPGRFLSGGSVYLSMDVSQGITPEDVVSGRFAEPSWLRDPRARIWGGTACAWSPRVEGGLAGPPHHHQAHLESEQRLHLAGVDLRRERHGDGNAVWGGRSGSGIPPGEPGPEGKDGPASGPSSSIWIMIGPTKPKNPIKKNKGIRRRIVRQGENQGPGRPGGAQGPKDRGRRFLEFGPGKEEGREPLGIRGRVVGSDTAPTQ